MQEPRRGCFDSVQCVITAELEQHIEDFFVLCLDLHWSSFCKKTISFLSDEGFYFAFFDFHHNFGRLPKFALLSLKGSLCITSLTCWSDRAAMQAHSTSESDSIGQICSSFTWQAVLSLLSLQTMVVLYSANSKSEDNWTSMNRRQLQELYFTNNF